jgi:hypothetical protein
LVQASADQKLMQSRRAVAIEALKAKTEVRPAVRLAARLLDLKRKVADALRAYILKVRFSLFDKAHRFLVESENRLGCDNADDL